jgi:hypothetical protein
MTDRRLIALVKPAKPIGSMSDDELEAFVLRLMTLMANRTQGGSSRSCDAG